MNSELKKYNEFSERSKLIDIALKYTDNDIERAKLMVSGQYNDTKIIKGKFDIDKKKIYSIFYIFLNTSNNYIMNINALVLPENSLINRTSIFDNWKTFYTDFGNFAEKEAANTLPAYEFTIFLARSINTEEFYHLADTERIEATTEKLIEIISKYYNVPPVHCQIHIDTSNSLSVELAGIAVEQPRDMNANQNVEMLDDIERKISAIESKADHVIDGRVIISPIKGKYINDIKPGDKIKILLTGKDEVTMKVAKALNAVTDDNEILPVTVRVTEKFPMLKNGHYIYGVVAKNVLVRVLEEENVKIEIDTVQKASRTNLNEKSKDDKYLMIYLTISIGILIIILFAIFLII